MRRHALHILWMTALVAVFTVGPSRADEIQIDRVEFAGHLSGIVMAYGDTPLAGINVSEISGDTKKVVKSVVTDSKGHFDLGAAERGVHTLRLQGNGYNTYWYRVRIDPKSKATLKLMMSTAS